MKILDKGLRERALDLEEWYPMGGKGRDIRDSRVRLLQKRERNAGINLE